MVLSLPLRFAIASSSTWHVIADGAFALVR
jgi:hypothetical protein